MKVFDTCFLIDFLEGIESAAALAQREPVKFTTQLCMYEVIRGLFIRNISPTKIKKIIELIGDFRVLPLNDEGIIFASDIFSQLFRSGNMISDNDVLIAGIAFGHGLNTIVTRNVKHFEQIPGLRVVRY